MIKKMVKILAILFCGCLFLFGGEEFFRRRIGGFAGSYPFVEYWELYAKEETVIKAVNDLKKEKPFLKPPADSSYYDSYWYYIDFYYPDTRQIARTWLRPGIDSTTTTLAFVGLANPGKNHEERLINRDFWYVANRREINKFEQQILERLKRKLYK